jgi:hypothetical protein
MYLKFSALLHHVICIFTFSPFLYTSFLSFSITLLKSADFIMSVICLRLESSFSDKFQKETLHKQDTLNILAASFLLIFTLNSKLQQDLCVAQHFYILYNLTINLEYFRMNIS